MSTNERDTHFQGFAKLLYQELSDLSSETIIAEDLNEREKQEIITLIAQRAYDLVWHAMEYDPHCYSPTDAIESIPDLTQWPASSTDQSS